LREVLDRYDAFAVGEMPGVNRDEQVAAVVSEERRELNMIFQFDIVDMDIGDDGKFSPREWDANTLKKIVGRWQTFMWEVNGWNALFLENHDQARSVSRFTKHRPEMRELAAKMLATFIGCQAGTLYVYQGQELGMTSLPEDWGMDEYRDIESLNAHTEAAERLKGDEKAMEVFMKDVKKKARDHARSPVQWNGEKNGGFTDAETPWMRVNDNYKELNAARQVGDGESVLGYWKKLLKVRKEYKDVLVYGNFDLVQDGHNELICYKRESDAGVVWVVLNFADEDLVWQAPEAVREAAKSGKQLLGTYEDAAQINGNDVTLRPFEARVILDGA
jgi:glycosidase